MSAQSTILVMQPIPDRPQASARLSTRPLSLSGRTVAFLDEGGPNADIMLDQLELELVERAGIRKVVRAKVNGQHVHVAEAGNTEVQTIHVPAEILDEVSRLCDAAVVGVGY
jgi:hypothetical protein